ncbi:histidine kinase [Paenibacillus swuensis]|uniref:histidine kinase n=1 Tax=Paenibacillus swuensis TaxID=1178515 RepID=A0A172TNL0_9BACL|nr:histidine kinase [Paenibacillus swuensis]
MRSFLADTFRVTGIQFTIAASIMIITIVVMAAVSGILYTKFSQTAENNTFLNNQQIVEQVNYNLDIYLRGMAQTFEMADDQILLNKGVPTASLREHLETILSTREDLVSVGLFTPEGQPIANYPNQAMRSNSGLTGQSWFTSALASPNHLSFSLPHIQNLYKGSYTWVVSMSKGISFTDERGRVDAVLVMDINFKTIDDLFRRVSLGQKGYVYIIDKSAGNIVYHPQQELIYSGLKYENVEQALKYTFGTYKDTSTGEDRLITIQTTDMVGWKIVGVSYMNEIVTAKREIGRFMVWMLPVVLLFVLLISAYMSAKISNPVRRLERSMAKVEQGDFDIQLQVKGDDEVGRLSRRFNIMVGRISQQKEQLIEEQEAKRRSELDVLQSQIHPHFLYNTLNSVVRMASIGKSEEVVQMITALSKFFRISLSKGKHIITVEEELEHIRNYLVIQKFRYKHKFNYVIRADEDVLSYSTLKLLLQPLVENAIYHGIEMMADEGAIEITASLENGQIVFHVRDDGLGIAPQKLSSLLSANAKQEGEGSGVGLQNVDQRIKLYYGNRYGITITSELEEGTDVRIVIPAMISDGEGRLA